MFDFRRPSGMLDSRLLAGMLDSRRLAGMLDSRRLVGILSLVLQKNAHKRSIFLSLHLFFKVRTGSFLEIP